MSSNLTLYRWRVYCNTEAAYRYIWLDENQPVPTTCPINTSDTIDEAQTRIVEERIPTKITIAQESTQTGGNYRWTPVSFTADPSTTTTYIFSYPYNINVLGAIYQSAIENIGDFMTWVIAPNTIVGSLTADVAINDTVLNVSSTVIDNIKIGFGVDLFDGVNTDDLGYVTNIDSVNSQITVSSAATITFLAATPTYVRMSIYFLRDVPFGHPLRMEFGESKILSSYVPANTPVHAIYTNNSGSSKEITAYIEILY